MNNESYFSDIEFFDKLNDNEKELFINNSFVKEYKKGASINDCGTACIGMIRVLSGTVRVYLLSDEGREITLYRLRKGDICVISASCVIKQLTFETQMVSEENSKILVTNSEIYSKIIENNVYARCFMYELITERFSSVLWTMQQILFLGFDKRLAIYLVNECKRNNSNKLKTTHEIIAKDIGSAREVVARMLKRFSSDNILTVKRGLIEINNISELKKIIE